MIKHKPDITSQVFWDHAHLIDFSQYPANLCSTTLFNMYSCIDCPFGAIGNSTCQLYLEHNPHLANAVTALKQTHPELFL